MYFSVDVLRIDDLLMNCLNFRKFCSRRADHCDSFRINVSKGSIKCHGNADIIRIGAPTEHVATICAIGWAVSKGAELELGVSLQ